MSSNQTIASKGLNTVKTGANTVSNKVKKTVSNSYQLFRTSNVLTQVLIVVIIIIFIILLVYLIRSLYNRAQREAYESPMLVTKPINAWRRGSKRPILTKKVPFPVDGLAFSYNMWVYVKNWDNNSTKNIFVKGNNNRSSPRIYLDQYDNILRTVMDTVPDQMGDNTQEVCSVHNFPLQKWVNLCYILNNNTVEIYINGKLEKSCILRTPARINNDLVYIGYDGGFYGEIAKMQYFTRALTAIEVASIYSEGPFISGIFGRKTDKKDDQNENEDNCEACDSYNTNNGKTQENMGMMVTPEDYNRNLQKILSI